LPGAKKFRKAGLRNENHLKVMFQDIISVDHSSPAADRLPSAPDSILNVENLDGSDNNVESFSEDNHGTQLEHNDDTQLGNNDVIQQNHDPPSIRNNVEDSHVTQLDHNDATQLGNNGVIQLNHDPPSVRKNKRAIHVNTMESKKAEIKKNKTETALLMQAQLKRIVDLAEEAQSIFEKFSSQVDSPRSDIQDVMTLVRECGARTGSDEYFIATELFVHSEQRQMFCTMETAEERLDWLRRKYNAKYR
jgi:hypothetical protein